MVKFHILAIEDDPGIAEVYRKLLGQRFLLTVAEDIASAYALLSNTMHSYDLVIVDLCLPDGTFLEIEQQREWQPLLKETPFLAVSVTDDLAVLESCLNSWACDYLVKPFNNNELLAKCNKLIATTSPLRLDPRKMILTNRGQTSEELTAKEFKILAHLLDQVGWQSEPVALLRAVWGDDSNLQRLHTGLSRLRPKLRPIGVEILSSSDGFVRIKPSPCP